MRRSAAIALTVAALLVLGVGVYRWMTSDLGPPAHVIVRPEIESAEPIAGDQGTARGSAVDPGPAPWETVGVSKKLLHLVARHEPLWRTSAQFSYVSVEDREAVRDAMQSHWERARFISLRGRASRAPERELRAGLGEVTERAIQFLGRSVISFDEISEEYMRDRRVSEEPMPQWLFDSYVYVFDSKQPFESNDEASKRKVIADFFDVRREAKNSGFLLTHVASSQDGFVGAIYWLGGPNDSRQRLFDLLSAEGKSEFWTGGISSSGYFLSHGQPALSERLRFGDVLWAEAYFIVQTANNDRLPMRVGAYYDPTNKRWHLAEVNFQSSPVWSSGSPTIVF